MSSFYSSLYISEAFRGGNMFVGAAEAGRGKALCLISPNLLQHVRETEDLQIDATFYSVPKP